MIALRAIAAIARADALERMRRNSFLVTLATTVWIGWLIVRGRVTLRLGAYAGQVNGAWASALVAVTISSLVSLVGFWIVKNAVQRDRDTRVGEILAATPLTKGAYTLGKFLSNFAVLATIVVALALAAPVLMWLHGGTIDLVPMAGPFLLIALPAMAVIAAVAVLFETIGPLSGGLGNVLWFFLWTALVAVPLVSHAPRVDLSGLMTLQQSMGEALERVHPDYDGGFSLTVGPDTAPVLGTFAWTGLRWTPSLIAQRLWWFAIAALIALAAAVPFDRFRGDGTAPFLAPRAARPEGTAGILAPLPAFLPPVFAGELRLMLNGRRWWWWAILLGLVVASAVAPIGVARGRILPFAWLWPVLIWSQMGAREAKDGTEELVFSAPRPIARQLSAVYLAGVTVALAAGAGVGVRCLATGAILPLAAWLVGACFIPALALACGAWSGSSKLFEAIYVVVWYVGPMQPVPALDFMGASDLTLAAGIPIYYAGAAAVCFGLALAGRRWKMAR